MTCYLRENGPIGYQLEFFGESPRAAIETLIDSGLAWAWKGRTREWTHLSFTSLSALLADLPGGALVVGLDEEAPARVTDEIVKAWMRRFCRAEPGPLAIAISAAPGLEVVFVQQHLAGRVRALLDALQVNPGTALRSAYARLGPASLESIVERL